MKKSIKQMKWITVIIVSVLLALLAFLIISTSLNIYSGPFKVERNGDEIVIIGLKNKHKNATELVIPETIRGIPVTSIDSRAFNEGVELKSIIIPYSVTSIYSLTGIGNGTFYGCNNLENIAVSEDNSNYKSIDVVLFNKAGTILIQCPIGNSRTSYSIPSSVMSIGNDAFGNCSGLTNISINSGVTSIGDRAFTSCNNLTSITIPDSVTSIGDGAFYGCNNLENIAVSEDNSNYKSIVGVLFNKAETILIQYPIGNHRTSYSILSSITSIGDDAFRNCNGLTSITFGDNSQLTIIGDRAFASCRSLISIIITSGVTSIGNYAFYFCTNLTDTTIQNNVTSIGSSAFAGCISLESITIPSSVTSIGTYAFEECSNLEIVIVENQIPLSIGENIFYNTSETLKIYVPSESVDGYKTAEGWSEYADKIFTIED